MRLTCPNCGAKYEVPAEVIPETGRDVQCSDCGFTWFQHHPDHPAAEDPIEGASERTPEAEETPDQDADYTVEEEPEPEQQPESEQHAAPEPEPEPEPETDTPAAVETALEDDQDAVAEPDPVPEPEPEIAEDAAEPASHAGTDVTPDPVLDADPDDLSSADEGEDQHDVTDVTGPLEDAQTPVTEEVKDDAPQEDETRDDKPVSDTPADEAEDAADAPVRQKLDENIAAVLRQEAEREAIARENERQSGLETQQDLGLPEQDSSARRRSEEAQARMARLRGEDATDAPGSDDTKALDPVSRSNLLPDIEEITSSLDTEENGGGPAAPSEQPPAPAPARSGFRTGFRIAVLLALVGLLIYVFAPQLAIAIPGAEGALTAYTNVIDAARAQLADFATGLSAPSEPSAE